MISSRRSFLVGVGASLIAAPAVVKAASLMPVRRIVQRWVAPGVLTEIDSSHQTGSVLIVTPLRDQINVGDVITIDDFVPVSRITGDAYLHPAQFVITAVAPKDSRVLSIYPPIIPKHPMERYQTVERSPKAFAGIRVASRAFPA